MNLKVNISSIFIFIHIIYLACFFIVIHNHYFINFIDEKYFNFYQKLDTIILKMDYYCFEIIYCCICSTILKINKNALHLFNTVLIFIISDLQ